LALLGCAAIGAQGCAAAAVGAGAGAAGTAYLTSRGAKAVVKGGPDTLQSTSQQVLADNAIEVTDQRVEDSGKKRELKGKKGDLDVTVSIERRDDQTSSIEVTAQKNMVEWDKKYAENLLNSIIKRT
jgi:hypothetical protein